MKALLVLGDGTVIKGKGFGAPGVRTGEVVFTTGMVGYTESLTDPSYAGQILVFTYPLIGNYGVAPYTMVDDFGLPLHFESVGIKVEGVVVHEVCAKPSHWASRKSLDEWLREEGVPGIWGVDTRELVKKLREKGVMPGALAVFEEDEEPDPGQLLELARRVNYSEARLAEKVSVKEVTVYRTARSRGLIAVLDCGVKLSIVRALLRRHFDVALFPYRTPAERVVDLEPLGVVVSNGPGNPELYTEVIKAIGSLIEYRVPILGICLGHQLVSLTLGARTYKLLYGHRGVNKPAVDVRTGRCYVTSQNHGYAVDSNTLKQAGLELWFINADDRTVEGVIDEKRELLCVQFHPEASPGPNDTAWVFDYFVKNIEKRENNS